MEKDTFYTVKEVSQLLKVHTTTIYRWIKLEMLRGVRIGKRGKLFIVKKGVDEKLK